MRERTGEKSYMNVCPDCEAPLKHKSRSCSCGWTMTAEKRKHPDLCACGGFVKILGKCNRCYNEANPNLFAPELRDMHNKQKERVPKRPEESWYEWHMRACKEMGLFNPAPPPKGRALPALDNEQWEEKYG